MGLEDNPRMLYIYEHLPLNINIIMLCVTPKFDVNIIVDTESIIIFS